MGTARQQVCAPGALGARRRSGSRRAWSALAGALLAACATPEARFPLRPPLWDDPDREPFGPRPAEYVSAMVWDGGDQMIFYPLTRALAVDPAGEAVNVNAFDEVADSSWFTNRLSRARLTPEEVALGPCARGSSPPPTPWKVTGGKPNGANPGFMIEDASGVRHLVKFDGVVQGPRATAADVIVSKLYHAAGYFVPCNRVVFFEPSAVSIGEGARAEDESGNKVPFTPDDLQRVFAAAQRAPDGRLRASASQFLAGKPIGPFTYQGVRDDDPNDVVPHQERRELRGMRLLAAWPQHFDAREQNTLDTWMETEPGRGYVRHNVLDFGDCFGSIWEPPALGRRLGHSYYFDPRETLEDWLTLGVRERPWDRARFGPSGKVFGYFDVRDFDPERWKPGYPNPAFSRMSERDGAWMARIIAQLGPEHLAALVAIGELGDPLLERELARILAGRRERILERYLTRLSPLAQPELRRGAARELCATDMVRRAGLRSGARRRHAVSARVSSLPGASRQLGPVRERDGERACVELPAAPRASASSPAYWIIDWVTESEGHAPEYPLRLHVYDLGGADLRVAGIERPESFEPPRR